MQTLLAFIPYWAPPSYALGPFTLQVFGLFVAAGVLLGARLMVRAAQKQGIDPVPLNDFPIWALIGGIIGAHLMHVLLYHPDEAHGFGIFKVWDGLSSTGGVIGGTLAALWFFARRHARFGSYADALALGVAPGWAVARIGCFAVHDHPGVLTSFPLAVNFPGGARHDLGLDDALVLFTISILLYALTNRRLLRGRLLPLLAVLYAFARFFLDFLRAQDLPYVDGRYFGLTPAQYVCVPLFLWGVWKLVHPFAPAPPEGGARPRAA